MKNEVLNEVSMGWLDREPTRDEIASFHTRAVEHFGGDVTVIVETHLGEGELYFLSARVAV